MAGFIDAALRLLPSRRVQLATVGERFRECLKCSNYVAEDDTCHCANSEHPVKLIGTATRRGLLDRPEAVCPLGNW